MAPRICFEDFKPGDTQVYGQTTVSREAIIAFAREFDPQPFHVDEVAAQSSFVGSLIASGWHSCALLMRMLADNMLLEASSMGAPGIEEVRWLHPVRPGDTLRLRHTVLEARPSAKRPQLGLVRLRFELLNQDDTVVLDQTNWIMFATREGWKLRTSAHLSRPVRQSASFRLPPPARPTPFFEDVTIGETVELGAYGFTHSNIVAFAQAFDPQPFHIDPEAARLSQFGALCASGWHTAAAWMKTMVSHRQRSREAAEREGLPAAELGPSPGFRDLVWRKPVYVGDTVTYHSQVTDKRASRSRPGWGLVFHRNTGVNSDGETVFSFDGCVFWQCRP